MRSATARPRMGPDASRTDPVPAAEGPVMRVEPGTETVDRREALAIFGGFGVLYVLVGLWVVGELHVVDFASLERLAHAGLAWHGDPPKLAAIGFEQAPGGTLLLLPFALIGGLVTSTLAIPLASAMCAAGTLVFIDRTLALGAFGRGPRLPLVALVGLNPMFALYAIDGPAEAAGLLFAAIGLFCLLSWGARDSPRHLVGGGLAFALGALTDYELIFWALAAALAVSGALTTAGRSRGEVEGSVIAFLAPAMYALGVWLLLNGVILGDPFAWISPGDGGGSPFDLGDATVDSLRAHMIFPAGLAIIALLLRFARDAIGISICALAVVSVGYPVMTALIGGSEATVDLRSALPAIVIGCAGLAWAHLRSPGDRPLIRVAAIVLIAAALPLAWWQMDTHEHQGVEQAFTRAISSGEDQEGSSLVSGGLAGIAPEREMARFIEDQDIAEGRVITDEADTYGVIALTDRPEAFLTRVGAGDDAWKRAFADPMGADYALVALDGSLSGEPVATGDLLPAGTAGDFEPLVANDRYALLRAIDPETAAEAAGSGG